MALEKKIVVHPTVMPVQTGDDGKDKKSVDVQNNSKEIQEKVPSGNNDGTFVQKDSCPDEDSVEMGKKDIYLRALEVDHGSHSAKEIDSSVVAIEMKEMTNGEEVFVQDDGGGFFSEGAFLMGSS